jgi:hypothetical protein
MRHRPTSEYTRRVKACLLVPCIVLVAGSTPFSPALAVSPSPSAMQSDDATYSWDQFVSWYLHYLWMIMNENPPPKLEDPAAGKVVQFNDAYATFGIRADLTAEEAEEFLGIALDLQAFLADDPGTLAPADYERIMTNLREIIEYLYWYLGDSNR